MTSLWNSESPLSPHALTRPSQPLPALSCDSHMHVFGPEASYPGVPQARYTWPRATAAQYDAVARAVGLSRVVIVQPSFYGTDNRCLLEALASRADHARGVAMVEQDPPLAQLREWHEGGVRGLRIDLFKAVVEGLDLGTICSRLMRQCERAASLGWSVDLYVPGHLSWQLRDALPALPCPVTIAHLGYLAPVDNISDRQCEEFADALLDSSAWVKISGFTRYGAGAGAQRAARLARRFLATMPERVIWGSDWPHVMCAPMDSGALLDELRTLCAEPSLLRQVLVDNPARLYGFAPTALAS